MNGRSDEERLAIVAGERATVLAEIAATVDLERALTDLGHAAATTSAARDDPLLGARVVVVDRLAIAEPTTEGRLAAFLARHGEGPAGRYVAAEGGLDEARSRAMAAGIDVSRTADGPFGRSILIPSGTVAGPLLVVVDRPGGTIAAMTDRQPVTVRAAAPADAERIAGLFTDEGYPAGPDDIVDRLGRFDSKYSRVFVADLEGEVLGFVAVHALPRFEHSDRIIRVMALVVDASVRERGVGRLLMEEAERLGREVGAAFAEVTAGHHRPDARRLYEELGYDGSVAAYLRKRL
jgi:GNAT superfamily N-acetyltransferase